MLHQMQLPMEMGMEIVIEMEYRDSVFSYITPEKPIDIGTHHELGDSLCKLTTDCKSHSREVKIFNDVIVRFSITLMLQGVAA